MRNGGGGFAEILRLRPQLFCLPLDKQAMFSTAQDDETGSAGSGIQVTSHLRLLIPPRSLVPAANLTFPSISPIILSLWKGVRVVEGGGLENR